MDSDFLKVFGIVTAFKVLLLPAKPSTDFEVHRNWLAITYSLPRSKWYLEATSEWTLDYPPFFAYFEWILSQVAKYCDPQMLDVNNLNYASLATVYFQKASVIVMDLVYALGVHSCMKALFSKGQQSTACMLLLLWNVGLIFVDHIHFQYNGFLYGILLLSISAGLQQRYLWCAFSFAVLLNLKHIFLYMAPAVAVYLLRFYCLDESKQFISSMLKLLGVGLLPFVVSFGPFLGQLPAVMARLFPFKRGLTHAYWAPNLWALYNTADKVIASVTNQTVSGTSSSSGLVQEVHHIMLPKITPLTTFILTLAFMVPILLKLLFFTSKNKSKVVFLRALVLCACSSFIFGWHVHEKAILMCLIPMCLLMVDNVHDAKYGFILGVAGYYSLVPLLFQVDLLAIRYTLVGAFVCLSLGQMRRIYRHSFWLNPIELLYIVGFLGIPFYEHLLSPYLGLDKRMPFMPLLMTSVYSALGVLYVFVRYYIYALDLKLNLETLWPSRRASKMKFSKTNRKRKIK